jgi:hypothetical protein
MNRLINFSVVFCFAITISFYSKKTLSQPIIINPKIQVALLLDVSNSMDGLIDQAKAELWSMVDILRKVKCNEAMPKIEIALYEYGREENDPKHGYIKQINAFTNDLDILYANLMGLSTHGGEEYCGYVMFTSLIQLNWDTSSASYKTIFIAGNESFLQGDIPFTKACAEAKRMGVIVNTIYCGEKNKGISENWNLGAECGNGSFSNIDQDAKQLIIPTPYDTSLFTLNKKLNGTYIPYGIGGMESFRIMGTPDTTPVYDANDPAKIARYTVRADKNVYYNPQWDLIDAMDKDSSIINTVELKTLPDSLKTKSRNQLREIIINKTTERRTIQKQIQELRIKQDKYKTVKKEEMKLVEPQTLGTEMAKILKQQLERFNMVIN